MLHKQNTKVSLASLAYADMASKRKLTERLNMSHMNDVIDIAMSTFESMSPHVTIGCGIVKEDHVIHLTIWRDIVCSGSSLVKI
jgi:hypothetical protein